MISLIYEHERRKILAVQILLDQSGALGTKMKQMQYILT